METVDVIIPAYRPGKEFEKLLDSLSTQNYPVEKILVMNTSKQPNIVLKVAKRMSA